MTTPSLLQEEIKQGRPFTSAAQEALLSILRTADQLKRRAGEVLEPLGVSPQQYNVLRILRGAGPQGLPTLEIGDRMIEQAPGITRLVDRLVDHGWADRLRCNNDRRVVYCRITPAGLDLLDRADLPLRQLDGVLVSELSEAEQRTLIAILERVRMGAATLAPATTTG